MLRHKNTPKNYVANLTLFSYSAKFKALTRGNIRILQDSLA